MALYRDNAIVLRTHKLGEADRIITLLTRTHGKVRAVAKGVRRTSSRIGARLEPFMQVDLQLYSGRNLDIVNQVELLHPYAQTISRDYQLYTAASAMVELVDRMVDQEHEPALAQYRLLHGALGALSRRDQPPTLLVDAFFLRTLAVAGYAPSFSECANCGAPGLHRYFAISMGGMVCAECRPPAVANPAPETVVLLSALLAGDWDTANQAPLSAQSEGAGLVAAYTQFHLERRVRSLGLVERAQPSAG